MVPLRNVLCWIGTHAVRKGIPSLLTVTAVTLAEIPKPHLPTRCLLFSQCHMIGQTVGFAMENAGDLAANKTGNFTELTFEDLSTVS